jgi:hypothetical protein
MSILEKGVANEGGERGGLAMGGWAITGVVGGTEKETETTLTSQVANPGIDHKGGWVGERRF